MSTVVKRVPKPEVDNHEELGQYSCPINATEDGSESKSMEIGTDREDRDVILGSAPSASASENASGVRFSAIQFDVQEFLQFVEGEDLSDDEAELVLRAIWDVMISFVDLAWGVDPTQQAVDGFDGNGRYSSSRTQGVLLSQLDFSETSDDLAAKPSQNGPAGEEDS